MSRNRLYTFLLLLSSGGYGWLAGNLAGWFEGNTLCFFKQLTGFACPACGSTRSAAMILRGYPGDALMVNPLGFIVIGALAFIPLWIITDYVRTSDSLLKIYLQGEKWLKKPMVAVPAALLLVMNWYWNISKNI